MHRFKSNFIDKNTFSNVQKCLRLNDLNEIGDSTHYLTFHMLGLFSFREMSLQETIKFWLLFTKEINNYPDYVTIHPDKKEWSLFYPKDIEIRYDTECLWTDGNIGGYCTEFYKNNVEIGNIVNTLEDCIDVGFGCERLLMNMGNQNIPTKIEIIKDTIEVLLNNGIVVSNNMHGYILKKLMTQFILEGGYIKSEQYEIIKENQIKIYNRYLKLKDNPNYQNKTSEWWFDTMGININNLTIYKQLIK